MITKPQNVMVLRDVMCNGYVAGCNTAFFGAKDPKAADKEYSKEQIQADINTRLTMADGDEVDYPSMLAFYEDFNEAAKRDQVISISNRVLLWDTTNGDTRDQFWRQIGWDLSAGKGLEGIHYGEDLPRHVQPGLHRGVDGQQLVCSSARTASFTAVERPTRSWCPGRGHLSRTRFRGAHATSRKFCNCLPCLHFTLPDRMLAGAVAESVSRESARNAMTGVEAVTHSQLVFQRRGASA